MQGNAIICEYNPFHNGHKYQIDEIKKINDNPIVAIMSGNFTQRGDIAIKNKFARTKYALENGVDLVIELPTVFATSSAQTFAKAGVEIAKNLGCIENLCFSAENGNDEYLEKIADAFENEDFNNHIKEFMETGTYYPKAVELALEKYFSKDVADIVTEPNNVLGIEYLKALKSTDIKSLIITRTAVGHNEDKCVGNITNASNIRKMIYNNADCKKYIPNDNIDFKDFASLENLEKIMLYKLRTMNADDFLNIADVSEGIENRIIQGIKSYNSIVEILNYVKTKRYTMARLRRIIIHALLGITKKEVASTVPYIRILGFNRQGQEFLTHIKNSCSLPLITNVSSGYNNLDENSKRIFNIDILASDIYSLATSSVALPKADFTNGIIKM